MIRVQGSLLKKISVGGELIKIRKRHFLAFCVKKSCFFLRFAELMVSGKEVQRVCEMSWHVHTPGGRISGKKLIVLSKT